jgi:hypothetical protein
VRSYGEIAGTVQDFAAKRSKTSPGADAETVKANASATSKASLNKVVFLVTFDDESIIYGVYAINYES